MYTIIKNEIKSQDEILNIIYGDNENYVKTWIEIYFDMIIEKKEVLLPDEKYFVEIENGIYYLVKKDKNIIKGYIYNTPQHITEKIFSIKYLKFTGSQETGLLQSLSDKIKLNELDGLYPEITNNINHKVLNQIDRESLYEIYCAFEGAIRTKDIWNISELIILQNKVTRELKKDLYSTVLKKYTKQLKKQPKLKTNKCFSTLPCKTIMIDENNKVQINGQIDLSKWHSNACSLEYIISNNKNNDDQY